MPKSKPAGRPSLPRRVVDGLIEAERLTKENKYDQAQAVLQELEKTYPNQPELLSALANVYFDLNDVWNYETAIRRLAKVAPRGPDIVYNLAGAYVTNLRPALALREYEDFLRRWPNDPRAGDVRKMVDDLHQEMDKQIERTGLPAEQALDMYEQHDEVRFLIDRNEYELARRAAEKLLKRYPNFVPAINNLSQTYGFQGDLERAIELERQALEKEPDNLHARATLARLLFVTGHAQEAREEAGRLEEASVHASDPWAKLAEVYTTFGDDQAVLHLEKRAKQAKVLQGPRGEAYFYHLLGVAALRLGKERDARRFWEKALAVSPGFPWAAQNLADLDEPPGQRNGPWPFPITEWLMGNEASELAKIAEQTKSRKGQDASQAAVSEYLANHPVIVNMAPHVFERGDETARQFYLAIAALSRQPELVELAVHFVQGQQGSFALRSRGVQMLSEADLLPPGPVKMWDGKKWTEILPMNFEITSTPNPTRLLPAVHDLFSQAYFALDQGDAARSRELLEQALAIQPDEPMLLFNLASSIGAEGDTERANEMLLDIHRRFPDYFFGIVGAAQIAASEGDYPRAHALLNRLLERKKLHSSEFEAMAMAQMDVWLAEGNREGARPWLEMLRKMDPEHPAVAAYEPRIGPEKRR